MADEETVEVNPATEEAPAGEATPAPAAEAPASPPPGNLDHLIDVSLRLTVEIGASKLLLGEVLQLGKGSVVELDRNSGEPADLFVNGRLIGRGEVTTVEDRLAVRIVELTPGDGQERSG
ncbi:MAG: flagellar motor switch protein FliN [Myxococcota bacterium]